MVRVPPDAADRLAFAIEDYLCRIHGIFSSSRAKEESRDMLRYALSLKEGVMPISRAPGDQPIPGEM